MGPGYSPHFVDEDHALAAGIILGTLMRGVADPEAIITGVQPFTDAEGNYTNQLLVTLGKKSYTITIDEALMEAMRD